MPGTVLFPAGFTPKAVLDGTEKVIVDGDREYATANAFAALAAGAAQTTQTVTSSPATVSARFIVLDDDSHTSGSPGSLVMPPITEGAWHVISARKQNVHYEVVQNVGDPANTGPDFQIDSSFVPRQTIVLFAATTAGQLRWQCDESGRYLTQLFSAINAIGSVGFGADEISGTSGAVISALDVYLTNAGANITVTLPDAFAGRRIRLHKENSATTQTITLVRSSGDTTNGATINGVAASYDIVLTGITGPYRSFDVSASDLLTWHVDNGESLAIASLVSSVSTNTSDIAALDTRIDALEVTGRQVITTATATILPGTRVVYIDHAAARTDLTLPATPFEPFTIVKRATSGSFGVRLIPNAGTVAIQGLAAGANFDISWMTTNASTTTARPAAFVSSSVVNVVDVA